MTCRVGTNVIACGPPRGVYRRAILMCPVCERRRRHVIRWGGAWYGSEVYCACGDAWQDGELRERPFERGWRKREQERFRAMWDNATTRELYDRYVRADVQFAVAGDDEWEAAALERDAIHAEIQAA